MLGALEIVGAVIGGQAAGAPAAPGEPTTPGRQLGRLSQSGDHPSRAFEAVTLMGLHGIAKHGHAGFSARWLSLLIAVGWLVGCASAGGVDRGEGSRETTRAVARRILADRDLDDVLQRAHALIASGFDAGSGYPELWTRDFATSWSSLPRTRSRGDPEPPAAAREVPAR